MPFAKEGRWILVAALVASMGCRNDSPPPYEAFWEARPPGDAGPFKAYQDLASEAESKAGKYLTRISFTPRERQEVLDAMSPLLVRLEAATRKPTPFAFSSYPPFEARPYQKGWRILGRALVWRIQKALEQSDSEAAVRWTISGTRFGYELTGGGSTDASLGLTIVREIRRTIAPSLLELPVKELGILSSGIANVLDGRPPIENLIANEHENMLAAIEAIQEAYRRNEYDELRKGLGPDGPNAVDYLEGMKAKDREARPLYFQNLASEAEQEANWLDSIANLPAAKRAGKEPPEVNPQRPWRRFARHFFHTLRPLLEVRDRELARTRLLALEAGLMAQVKAQRTAPTDLRGYPEGLRLDPYSGLEFRYSSSGADYRVYSVGQDLRDDGGATDEQREQPDLRLER